MEIWVMPRHARDALSLSENDQKHVVGSQWQGPDFSQDWHVFALDWRPDALVWFVDGVERWRFTDASAIPAESMYLLINLAVGGEWPGSPDATTVFPSLLLVDYVRVWQSAGGPP
jgi:beta-glucanase (GH16 family)